MRSPFVTHIEYLADDISSIAGSHEQLIKTEKDRRYATIVKTITA
jgi:hypothetical protein